MDVMGLKLDPAWIIAAGSSRGDGRPRWTEINVYVLPADVAAAIPTKRRYVAEVLARSSMQGERTKTRRVATGTLDRALDWIDDSDLGAAVKVNAREWMAEQQETSQALQRRENERTINEVLWPLDSPEGRQFLIALVDEVGLACLTDQAVAQLAQRQRSWEIARHG